MTTPTLGTDAMSIERPKTSSRSAGDGKCAMRLYVPESVYDKLKGRFETLSDEDDKKFLMRYRQTYGEGAYQYLMRTYRSAHIGGRHLLKASPSGQTQRRLLKLIPTVMSSKERFELFEAIIDYNECNALRYSHRPPENSALDKTLSFSFDEWTRFGEKRVKACIADIGEFAVRAVDYKARYDFSDIEWLMDGDITAFCHLVENKRREELKSSVAAAISEVDALGSKWRNLADGTVGPMRKSEMKYRFSLAGHDIHVTIFDAKERARLAAREKLNDFLGKVGCLAVIVFIIICSLMTKK